MRITVFWKGINYSINRFAKFKRTAFAVPRMQLVEVFAGITGFDPEQY